MVVRAARGHLLSMRRVDGHGGGRRRPQAAAGSARASVHVWEVGVDAGVVRAEGGKQGRCVHMGRGGVQGGVHAHDDMPGHH